MKDRTLKKLRRNIILKKILEKLQKLGKNGELDFLSGFFCGAGIAGFPLLIVGLFYKWPTKYTTIIGIIAIVLFVISNITIAISGALKSKKINKNDEP